MRLLSHKDMRKPGAIISFSFALAVLPLATTLMSWVWILFACTIGVVWAKIIKRIKPLNNLTLNLLAVFCMLLLVFFSGQFGLLSTMINLLIVAGCLKLITMRSFADFHMITVVVIFLVACGFIYHQDLVLTAYYALLLFAAITSAYLLNAGKVKINASLKQSMKLIAQALPITVLLFIMVPRLPPLWEAAQDKSTGTGLSETLTPGDIASLAQSGELAFRAEFTDYIPSPQERYWRSIVMQHFDGKTWSLGEELSNTENTPQIDPEGPATRYLIVAEPNDTRWQYSLDIPVVEEVMSDRRIMRNNAYQLFTEKENTKKSMYIVSSYLNAPLKYFLTEYELQRSLQVPREGNPRTQDFVKNTITDTMTVSERVGALLSVFRTQNFSYTLKPPFMQNEPIDQFLFDYQEGFCSHYASALTYMLRLANVPARVVAGYQGGELQSNNILTIRQYDAHAWVEYWDEATGWSRLDPTAIVAPNRLIDGLLSSLSEEDSELVERPFNLSEFNDAALFREIHDFFVMLDHQWTQSVLRYDQDAQRDLIKKWFGAFNAKNMTTFMFLILGAITLFIALIFVPYKNWFTKQSYKPEAVFLASMAKQGHHKQPSETMKDFVTRIKPNLNEKQQHTAHLFVLAFYKNSYANQAVSPAQFKSILQGLN